jgi:hypothetical protein
LRFPPVREYFAGELMIEEGPRDRAVRIRSKKALVQARSESAKQLAFTNGPFGRTTKQVMPEITEMSAKVVWSIGKGFYDIERLGKCEDTCESQQELLPNSMTGS